MEEGKDETLKHLLARIDSARNLSFYKNIQFFIKGNIMQALQNLTLSLYYDCSFKLAQ